MLSRRRFGSTAVDAVVASAPATSLVTALGLAGGGYLTGREGVAACGAVVGAFGLVAERWGNRGLRLRVRRERLAHRADLRQVSDQLLELQRQLAGLRADLDGVRAERDDVRAELAAALAELSGAQQVAARPVVPPAPQVAPAPPAAMPQGVVPPVVVPPVVVPPVVMPRVAVPPVAVPPVAVPHVTPVPPARPVQQPVAAHVTALPAVEVVAVPVPAPAGPVVASPAERQPHRPTGAPVPLSGLLPGQLRSPIATGGIPVLEPGPTEPVRTVIDLRTKTPLDDPESTQPIPALAPEVVDALVYAAMAEADAAAVARSIELPGRPAGRHAGPLHTGDAHHAGDYARDDEAAAGTCTLVVVKRGRHVA